MTNIQKTWIFLIIYVVAMVGYIAYYGLEPQGAVPTPVVEEEKFTTYNVTIASKEIRIRKTYTDGELTRNERRYLIWGDDGSEYGRHKWVNESEYYHYHVGDKQVWNSTDSKDWTDFMFDNGV